MDHIGHILANKDNVNVDNNLNNNVYDENVVRRIQEALDKPKAIAEIFSEELQAPHNTKLYIRLAYEYPTETLFRCLALTKEARSLGLIRTDMARYFYGIVRRQIK